VRDRLVMPNSAAKSHALEVAHRKALSAAPESISGATIQTQANTIWFQIEERCNYRNKVVPRVPFLPGSSQFPALVVGQEGPMAAPRHGIRARLSRA